MINSTISTQVHLKPSQLKLHQDKPQEMSDNILFVSNYSLYFLGYWGEAMFCFY